MVSFAIKLLLAMENARHDSARDFTSLSAWQKARELRNFFYLQVIVNLPRAEYYNLNLQIRKAAVSVTANIAEGYGRYFLREGIRFYLISRASIYELKDHLICCEDLAFIDSTTSNIGFNLIEEAKRTLNGYIKFVESRIEGQRSKV